MKLETLEDYATRLERAARKTRFLIKELSEKGKLNDDSDSDYQIIDVLPIVTLPYPPLEKKK